MRLSILICSLVNREFFRQRLTEILDFQIQPYKKEIEILWEIDNGEISIGTKRNKLMDRATGDYVCFIDDDDRPSWDYIPKVMKGLESNPDCLSMKGVITENGLQPKTFIHSLAYHSYFEQPNEYGQLEYYRFPNHLNVIKREIAKQFKFPEVNFSEDTSFAYQVNASGLLKTQVEIEGIIYNYDYIRK